MKLLFLLMITCSFFSSNAMAFFSDEGVNHDEGVDHVDYYDFVNDFKLESIEIKDNVAHINVSYDGPVYGPIKFAWVQDSCHEGLALCWATIVRLFPKPSWIPDGEIPVETYKYTVNLEEIYGKDRNYTIEVKVGTSDIVTIEYKYNVNTEYKYNKDGVFEKTDAQE